MNQKSKSLNRASMNITCTPSSSFFESDGRSCQLKLIKMRAELANLNNCAVPFLSRAAVNLSWYHSTLITTTTRTEDENNSSLYDRRKNNCQKIYPAHSTITKRGFILRGSHFCERYSFLFFIH